MDLSYLKEKVLVFDVETSSFDENGKEIEIRSRFDDYVANAKIKWFGAYSFKENKGYCLNAQKDAKKIIDLLDEHDILVGFNSEEFDYPILVNNGFTIPEKYYNIVDCMVILGNNTFQNRKGFKFKGRGELMKYNFVNNSLRTMAEEMGLETQKGEIDFKIFNKDVWTAEEEEEIKKYLKADVMVTKQMFQKLWDFWKPFTELLDIKYVNNLSWLKNSIASLTYKCSCSAMGVEATYSQEITKTEEMGGRVLDPKYEEKNNVWYVDFSSLYPHLFCMANLFAETEPNDNEFTWHGNDVFHVKGYYNISHPHKLTEYVGGLLKERFRLKEEDPDNPMEYAIKILCNCFSEDTEIVMADNTIKKIKDCKIGEIVYTLNPKTLIVEKKPILQIINQDYNGYLHYYSGHYFDFKNTPNHRFLLQHKKNSNDIRFIESNNIESQHKIPIHKKDKKVYKKNINILNYIKTDNLLISLRPKGHLRTWLYNNKIEKIPNKYNQNNRNMIFNFNDIKNKLTDILKQSLTKSYVLTTLQRKSHKIPILYNNKALSYIIGIYLAEGSTSKSTYRKYPNGNVRGEAHLISIAQYREVNPIIYKKITDALDECGLKYSAGKHQIKISGKIFYDFILENFGSLGNKCFKNKQMFDELHLESVFEALIDGDGTKKSYRFTTKYDCLKNDFIELCMRLGYTFQIKNDGCWRIVYNKTANSFRKANRTNIRYNNKVYCVNVENNTILAGSSGKFNWTGNSLYGVARSPVFEKVHTTNSGWDCCSLAQQIHEIAEKMLNEFGFEVVYGDTDSCFLVAKDEKYNTREYLQDCLQKIVEFINKNLPFPIGTFSIKIENYLDYIMWPFSDQPIQDEEGKNIKKGNRLVKKRAGKKKNYLYLYKKDGKTEINIMGFPLIKNNATFLGLKIYEEVLKPLILEKKRAKFSKEFIDSQIQEYLKNPEIMELMSIEYKVKPFDTYKNPSQIQAQISRAYCNGEGGIIRLIKNNKVGKAGKGQLYCSIEEALENKLSSQDLDLTKVMNELAPFIEYVP